MKDSRERLATLLSATRIAVVGASSDPSKITGRPIAYMLKRGFRGEIIPINPRHTEIQGLRAYPSLSAVGAPMDLALIGTAAADVEAAVLDGIAAGIRSFVILSSGFSEHNDEGSRLQARLTAIAHAHDATIVGPNCLGVINAETGLIASFTTAMEENALRSGGFGFASQSGALGAYWLDLVLQAGLGVSRWVTTGNECDVDLAAAISMLAADPMTRVIGVYCEGVKDGPAFRQALLQAAQAGKPVFIIKAGRSSAGTRAAASHTGSLTGQDHIYQVCFDECGAIRVDSVTDMIDAAKLVLHDAIPASGKIGVMSVSGGAGVMLADAIDRSTLTLPVFEPSTIKLLAQTLPSYSKPQNPIDLTAGVLANIALFSETLKVVGAAPELDACVLFVGLMHSISTPLTQAILEARQSCKRPFIIVWIGARPDTVAHLNAAGIPVYPDIPQAVAAMDNVNLARKKQARASSRPQVQAFEHDATRPQRALAEWQGKDRLRELGGIGVPKGVLVSKASELAQLGQHLRAPYVAKLQSPVLLHKSEHGAVKLGLRSLDELEQATETLQQIGRQEGIPQDGVLVEEMVPYDLELIVGLRYDPTFGPLLMIGRGGIEAELDPDIATALSPCTASDIKDMLRSLRCAPLLLGYRGGAGIDIQSVATSIAHLDTAFRDDPQLSEVEINPLAVRGSNVTALDVLIKLSEP